ncbi:MAG: spore coat associated protein CotJA [Peptococcaceae bacterium]|nr:spore coat associated protein CotJA [Peptococcaceae bacterium]
MEEARRVVVMRPGYTYVPPQKFETTYKPDEALEKGTLFPILYLPMSVYADPMGTMKGDGRRG